MACPNPSSIGDISAQLSALTISQDPACPPICNPEEENNKRISTVAQEGISAQPLLSNESLENRVTTLEPDIENKVKALIKEEKLEEAQALVQNMPDETSRWYYNYKITEAWIAKGELEKALVRANTDSKGRNTTLVLSIAKAWVAKGELEKAFEIAKDFLPDVFQQCVYPLIAEAWIAKEEPIQALHILKFMDLESADNEYLMEQLKLSESFEEPFEEILLQSHPQSMLYKKIGKDLITEGKLEEARKLSMNLPSDACKDFFYEGIITALIAQQKLEAATDFTALIHSTLHKGYYAQKILEALNGKTQTKALTIALTSRETVRAFIRKGELNKACTYTQLMLPAQDPESIYQAIAMAWLAKGELTKARDIARILPQGYEQRYVLEKIDEAEKKVKKSLSKS